MIATAVGAFKTCCKEVSPYDCVKKSINLNPSAIQIGGCSVPLDTKVVVIGFGKAVLPMISAADAQLGQKIVRGIGIAPSGIREHSVFPSNLSILEAGQNNLPDENSFFATNTVVDVIRQYDSPETVFLFLISGGGSALLCSPRGITLAQKLAVIQEMTSHGADIQQLNTVRQKLSNVKGGKLLENVRYGEVVSLIVSDIIGDPLALIASGPTVPQSCSQGPRAVEIVENLGIKERIECIGSNIMDILKEQPAGGGSPFGVHNHIVCSNTVAVDSLHRLLHSQGFAPLVLSKELSGNASEVGEMLAQLALCPNILELRKRIMKTFSLPKNSFFVPENKKIALILGGETTVVIRGTGRGGRNQEMMLSALIRCAKAQMVAHEYVVLSCGTDGQDGPTDAAGACFSSSDVCSVNVKDALSSLNVSDSYSFWDRFLGGARHVKTGPTGTNVMDMQIILIDYQ